MRTWQLTDGTQIWQVLAGRTNSYLVRTQDGTAILIDTGMERVQHELMKNIISAGFPDWRLNYLLLTHTHFDHCRNASFLKEKTSCQIVLHESEARYVRSGYTPVPEGTNAFTFFLSKRGKAIGRRWFGYHAFEPDILISDNQPLMSEASGLQILNTPGHTAGSISLILNREVAIAGDALFGVFPHRVLPPFADDRVELVRSWKRLLDTGCNLFLPGHGNPITRRLLEHEYLKYTAKPGMD